MLRAEEIRALAGIAATERRISLLESVGSDASP